MAARIASEFLAGRCAAVTFVPVVGTKFSARSNQTQTTMKTLLSSLLGRAGDLAQTQPLLALCLGSALFAVFLSLWLRVGVQPSGCPPPEPPEGGTPTKPSLVWLLYSHLSRFLFAAMMVLLLAQTFGVLRSYLRKSVAHFQQTHGRVTEANYKAVETIWGAEQTQRELTLQIFYDEEVTERTEFEDPAKPAIIRKKTVRHNVVGNPFVATAHTVTLTQNARKKGSALYGGYETACRFSWKLKSPADRETKGTLRFPLPAQGAMYDDLTATINGKDVLPKMELSDAALVLTRDLATNEEWIVTISFKSRGMSQWYFQVPEQREIRDFTLALNLPDLPKAKLNYPEGCMSPTDARPTADGRGSLLTYRLDHAISHKGMGIALPTLPQPGAATNAVLGEAERGWMLIVAVFLLTLTLSAVRHGPLLCVLFASAIALAFGALGDFSDLLFGFWGTAVIVFLPLLLFLAWMVKRIVSGTTGKILAALLLVFGLLYPAATGLDGDRQSLYLNVCGFLFLAFTAWQLADELRASSAEPSVSPQSAR